MKRKGIDSETNKDRRQASRETNKDIMTKKQRWIDKTEHSSKKRKCLLHRECVQQSGKMRKREERKSQKH